MNKTLLAVSFTAILSLPLVAMAADQPGAPAGDAEAHAQGIYTDPAPMTATPMRSGAAGWAMPARSAPP
jgi:hypothetical protein